MLIDDTRESLRPEPLGRRRLPAARAASLSPISLVSLLYALSLYVFYQQGLVSRALFVGALAMTLCCVALFHAMFRTGLNGRFDDPSLMLPQIVAALVIMLAIAYLERATRLALVPFVLIVFSFAIFRLSTFPLALLAAGCLAAYFGIIVVDAQLRGHTAHFRTDLTQWFMLAFTLPATILVGKQIQHLRQLLKATRYQLEHYEEKSARDELTGLYNRRQLQVELERARLQADTTATPFSICLIDIDRFKEINDVNGHLAGDAILREFADLARDSIRDSDLLGRYGGDEFMLILPDTDLKGAVMHAERLRVHTHFLDFQECLAQKCISLSIGVAQYRGRERIDELIARADAALYRAKQNGRNRVEWKDAD